MTRTTVSRSHGSIQRYAPDASPCAIDLSDNTNAWGMPPAVQGALANAAWTSRYPSAYADGLKRAIGEYADVPVEMITTGCGSDDVLDSTLRSLADPGEVIAMPDPPFAMIPILARLNRLTPVAVPMTANFDIDVDGLLSSGARIIYVSSPNNPTGNAISRRSIEALMSGMTAGQVIVIDEAYVEFGGASVLDLAHRDGRVVVTRTFSKAFGLAGLRVGYAIASPHLIEAIEAARGPYKVSAMGEGAAITALTDGREWVARCVAAAVDNRSRLAVALFERGLAPVPSSANFVYVPIDNASALANEMRRRGVAVRAFGTPPALRITVADWDRLSIALDAFDEARRVCG
jgi:histidinol-phosphate aminotransferase